MSALAPIRLQDQLFQETVWEAPEDTVGNLPIRNDFNSQRYTQLAKTSDTVTKIALEQELSVTKP